MNLRKRLATTDLAAVDPGSTPKAPGGKSKTKAAAAAQVDRLALLQERLFAEGTLDSATRRVLVVLQGMDASGKDGAVKHVAGAVNPSGLTLHSFKKPTEQELRHNFLWRIRRAVPEPGYIGVFNRSHYEDVLIVRVHNLIPKRQWEARYDEINSFERKLVEDGVTVIKVMLHISYEEQRERLIARLDNPAKHWKFNAGDIAERARWVDYQAAYADAIKRCSEVPWHVIPADHKWYRDWALGTLLLEHLEEMDPQYPARPDLDIAALKKQLLKD